MIIIVLWCVLGVVVVVYLLFRRLRQLSWQLTQLRVEHDCDQILRAIGVPPLIGGTIPHPASKKHGSRVNREDQPHAALNGIAQGLRRHRLASVAAATLVAALATTALVLDSAARSQNNNQAEAGAPPASPRVSATERAAPVEGDRSAQREPEPQPSSRSGPVPAASPQARVIVLSSPGPREPDPARGGSPPPKREPTPTPPAPALPPTAGPTEPVEAPSDGLCLGTAIPVLRVPCLGST